MADREQIAKVDINEVVKVMMENEIMEENKEWYVNGRNRRKFVKLLMEWGICGYFANQLWCNLGGASVTEVAVVYDEEEELEEEDDDDDDLDQLNADLAALYKGQNK